MAYSHHTNSSTSEDTIKSSYVKTYTCIKKPSTTRRVFKRVTPIIDELAEEYDGKVDIYKVDVDAEEDLARLFRVRSIPTLVYIPMGELPIVELGGKGKGEIKEKLNEYLLTK